MSKNQTKKFPFPPVFKLLVRGYIIIAFVLILEFFGIIDNVSFIIFMVTIVSISMMFGVSYLLVTYSKPVRSSSLDIPNTVLLFVKGGLVIYFISLVSYFQILPKEITSILITLTALILMLVGVLSYLYEIIQRSRPFPGSKPLDYGSKSLKSRG
jgi:hypothetical protein